MEHKHLSQKTIAVLLATSVVLLVIVPRASSQSAVAPAAIASWPDGNSAYTDESYLRLKVNVSPGPAPDHVRWYDPQGERTYFTSSGPGEFHHSHYVYYGGFVVGIQHFYSITRLSSLSCGRQTSISAAITL